MLNVYFHPQTECLLQHLLHSVHTWQRQLGQDKGSLLSRSSRAIIFVPETQKLLIETSILEAFPDMNLMFVEVKSLRKWCKEFINEYFGKRNYLSKAQKIFLLQQCLVDQNTWQEKSSSLPQHTAYAEEALEALSDFRRLRLNGKDLLRRIDIKKSEEGLSKKAYEHLQNLATLFTQYEKILSLTGLEDDELIIDKTALCIESLTYTEAFQDVYTLITDDKSFFSPLDSIWIYGFGEDRLFTQQELHLFQALFPHVKDFHFYLKAENLQKKTGGNENKLKASPFYYAEKSFLQITEWLEKKEKSLNKIGTAITTRNEQSNEVQVHKLENMLKENTSSAKCSTYSFANMEDAYHYALGYLVKGIEEKNWQPSELAIVTEEESGSRFQAFLREIEQKGFYLYYDQRKIFSESKLYKIFKNFTACFFMYYKAEKADLDALLAFLRSEILFPLSEDWFQFEHYLEEKGIQSLIDLKEKLLSFIAYYPSMRNASFVPPLHRFIEEIKQLRLEEKQSYIVWLNKISQLCSSWKMAYIQKFSSALNQAEYSLAENLKEDWKNFTFLFETYFSLFSYQADTINKINFSTDFLEKKDFFTTLKTKRVSLNEAVQLLLYLSKKIQNPRLPNQREAIFVGTSKQALGQNKKHWIIFSAKDEHFPFSLSSEGLLKNKEREILSDLIQLPVSSKKREASILREVYLYKIAQEAKKGLTFFQEENSLKIRRTLAYFSSQGFSIEEKCFTRSLENRDLRLSSLSLQKAFALWKQIKQGKRLHTLPFPLIDDKQSFHLDPIIVKSLLSKEKDHFVFSSTGLEHYQASPFSFFLHYILGAKTFTKYEDRANLQGEFYHKLLENYLALLFNEEKSSNSQLENKQDDIHETWKELKKLSRIFQNKIAEQFQNKDILQKDQLEVNPSLNLEVKSSHLQNWKNFLADFERSLEPYLQKIINENQHFSLYHEAFYKNQALRNMRKTFIHTLFVLFTDIHSHPEYKPQKYEQNFLLPFIEKEDATIFIKGTIDRLDQSTSMEHTVLEDNEQIAFRIIDYKSGSKQIDLSRIYHGLDFQLPLYLWAAQKLDEVKYAKGRCAWEKVDAAYLPVKTLNHTMWRDLIEGKQDSFLEKHFYSLKESLAAPEYMEDLKERSLSHIRKAIENILQGYFPLQFQLLDKEKIKDFRLEPLKAFTPYIKSPLLLKRLNQLNKKELLECLKKETVLTDNEEESRE